MNILDCQCCVSPYYVLLDTSFSIYSTNDNSAKDTLSRAGDSRCTGTQGPRLECPHAGKLSITIIRTANLVVYFVNVMTYLIVSRGTIIWQGILDDMSIYMYNRSCMSIFMYDRSCMSIFMYSRSCMSIFMYNRSCMRVYYQGCLI